MSTVLSSLFDDPNWHRRPTITLPQAAEVLSCSVPLIYEMAKRGDVPTVQISQRRFVVPTQQLLAKYGIDPIAVSDSHEEERTLHAVAADS